MYKLDEDQLVVSAGHLKTSSSPFCCLHIPPFAPSFTARDANQRINWAVESYGDIVRADPVVAQLHPFDPWLGLRGLDLIAQLGLLTAHAACLVMVTSAPLVQE